MIPLQTDQACNGACIELLRMQAAAKAMEPLSLSSALGTAATAAAGTTGDDEHAVKQKPEGIKWAT